MKFKLLKRIGECLFCKYFDRCTNEVDDPEEYPDLSCKQKDIFKDMEVSDENQKNQ